MIGEVLTLTRADGGVVCVECRVASSFATRLRGLLGAARLPHSRGLLLSRTSSIHTHFMRFPIDVVFLDDAMTVVEVVEDLAPWRFARCPGASAVLELAAGTCRRVGLRPGDRLALGSGEVSAAEDRPRRGIRVAVSTRDRRFDRVATFLLARDGFVVTRGRNGDGLAELARQGAVDVVLLDASDSLASAARTARSLEAVAPEVGLVLVVDGDDPDAGGGRHDGYAGRLDRVGKWGPFERVVDAVERSYAASRAYGHA